MCVPCICICCLLRHGAHFQSRSSLLRIVCRRDVFSPSSNTRLPGKVWLLLRTHLGIYVAVTDHTTDLCTLTTHAKLDAPCSVALYRWFASMWPKTSLKKLSRCALSLARVHGGFGLALAPLVVQSCVQALESFNVARSGTSCKKASQVGLPGARLLPLS